MTAVPRLQQARTRGQLVVYRTDSEQESLLQPTTTAEDPPTTTTTEYRGRSAYHYYYRIIELTPSDSEHQAHAKYDSEGVERASALSII